MVTREPKIITVQGGAVALPDDVRERYGLRDGSTLIVDASESGILLRPFDEDDIEIYTPERKAEFFLNNALDAEDYAWAVSKVRRMGIDPDSIPHKKPSG